MIPSISDHYSYTQTFLEESVRATPEELRKNLEALECSLDEISSEKNSQQKPVNPCKLNLYLL